MVILNRYKNTLDNLIDSLDIEYPDWPGFSQLGFLWLDSPIWPEFLEQLRQIDKSLNNISKSRSGFPTFLKENCLRNNILVILLKLLSTI